MKGTSVSNPVKDRSGLGKPPKAERRAAGRLAAQQRAAALRRKKYLKNALTVIGGLAVIVAAAYAFGAFDGDTTAGSASGTPSASTAAQLPPDADPALATKPTATAGTEDLTKLAVTTLIEGKGAAVQAGQTISVNYVGVSYRTGEEFDSSWSRSQPYEFPLGGGEVIKGWDQGLVGVKVGSRVQLDIPADLAYGETGQQPGPLRFIVDVLSAK